ncbi:MULTISPECIES: cellulose biosynthesis protein BcsC [unclassified Sphingomonas]|uniref:cellulose biosynthesis protein BcsC n=1 Tax=unclassified Sphingomonas TaxID=196159 RepID=UPI000E7136D3|nr:MULTISPECIES: cellulose biosynthesis protein BcsC [unclassified Sphingomonas]RKE42793.1 tetratricopeptide repeat protein [Sphingomonas sp. PP-CC-1A-547]TCM05581.1 tetratricopeptide repeat protein [Sphingomonas sp. PP-CC-3G-468]
MIRFTTLALLTAGIASPLLVQPAVAQVAGVGALVQQGRYWQSRGRADLARTAYRRALAIDPSNAEARRALSASSAPSAAPAARPSRAPAQAPASMTGPAPAPSTASRTIPAPAPARRAAPTPSDRGGDSRAAGFRSLEQGDLAQAQRQFEAALANNRSDADAAGGLGVVRLRQSRFAESAELLLRASARGNRARWSEALASAQFYAGLDDARARLAAGDVVGAQTQAEALARTGVKDRGPALALLADIYERQGRYADSADLARQAGSAGGSAAQLESRVVRNDALQAATHGDPAKADALFQRGLMLDPADPWIRYEYARYMIGQSRAPEAEALIQSIQTIGTADALYAAAMLHNERGRQAQATSLLSRLTEAQKTPAIRRFEAQIAVDSAVARAKAIAAQGRGGEAIATLRQIGMTPTLSAASLASIAGGLNDLGDQAGAVPLAERALAASPATAADYEPIVRVLARTGQDAAVASAIDRARTASARSASAAPAIARLEGIAASSQADRMRLAGQNAQAFDLLQQAWAASPGNADVLGALGRLYQSGNMPSQAAQTYQMVLAANPRDKGALIGLIGSAGAGGNHDVATATVDRALAAYPDDYEIYAAAGQMEQARGDRGAAKRYLRRAETAYAARSGTGATLSGANPFAAGMGSGNPFRQAEQAPIVAANPFALSAGPIANSKPGRSSTPMAFTVAPGYGAGSPGVPAPTGFAPGGYASSNGAVPQAGVAGGDATLIRLRDDIARLSDDTGPRAEMKLGFRERSGETGLSEMRELSGTATLSTGVAGGRVSVSATPVVIDSGRPTGSALARFGRNATPEAQGIVNALPSVLTQADTQHASGVAVAASYDSPGVRIEVGSTPIGFDNTEVTWGFTGKPKISRTVSAQGWVKREPVTDSVVSYAGTRDPVTGERWGQVMRTGGGASLSWDDEGTGVYADVSGYRYTGENVRRNRGYQANAGGYLPLYRDGHSTLTGGLNLNWQAFDNNQNYFTYGHGGYFSPQSFLSMSLPIRYAYNSTRWEGRLGVAPGYQSFEQDRAPIYPTDPNAQAELDALKARNTDVRSYYDSLSNTGFAFSADGSLFYRLNPNTRIGASASANTFGTYDDYRSTFELRQSLGGTK